MGLLDRFSFERVCFHSSSVVRFWCRDQWLCLQPHFSLHTFTGHNSPVMSVDFHPKKTDLFCSCDGNGEMRFWNTSNFALSRVSKVWNVPHSSSLDQTLSPAEMKTYSCLKCQGATGQVRFQPRLGQLLAASAEKLVSIFDIEADRQIRTLPVKTTQVIAWVSCLEIYLLLIGFFWIIIWSPNDPYW